jgi:cytochrome b561
MGESIGVLRYDPVSRALHWWIAALAFAQLAMGKFFEVEAGEEGSLFGVHTALGLVVLLLMLLRLGWRLGHPAPRPPASMPRRQVIVAHALFGMFYLLLVVQPLTGWLLTSVEGDAVSFFGLFGVPALPVPGGEASEEIIEEAHELMGNALLVLAALHTLMGLKHHFIDKDDVLRRMLPG